MARQSLATVYADLAAGEYIADSLLLEAIAHYKQLVDLLYKSGPEFRIAGVEANRTLLSMKSYADARGLKEDLTEVNCEFRVDALVREVTDTADRGRITNPRVGEPGGKAWYVMWETGQMKGSELWVYEHNIEVIG